VSARIFHGRFLRSAIFLLQNCATLRNALPIELVRLPYEKHAVQRRGNVRKHSLGNYESPALTPKVFASRPLSYRPMPSVYYIMAEHVSAIQGLALTGCRKGKHRFFGARRSNGEADERAR
jgi:hypothetical protein